MLDSGLEAPKEVSLELPLALGLAWLGVELKAPGILLWVLPLGTGPQQCLTPSWPCCWDHRAVPPSGSPTAWACPFLPQTGRV